MANHRGIVIDKSVDKTKIPCQRKGCDNMLPKGAGWKQVYCTVKCRQLDYKRIDDDKRGKNRLLQFVDGE